MKPFLASISFHLAVGSLCFIGSEVGARAAQSEDNFEVLVNGTANSATAPYYSIFPGRANNLTVNANPLLDLKEELTATLITTRPDGRSDEVTATFSTVQRKVAFDLGAFAVPAEYDYEHGVVYRRGYRFKLKVAGRSDGAGSATTVFDYYQGLARTPDAEALWPGDVERYVYNGGYEAGKGWQPNKESGLPMDPPFLLKLDWAVLSDANDVRVQFSHQARLGPAARPAKLVVVRLRDGATLLDREVSTTNDLKSEQLEVSDFETGEYRIVLLPVVTDTARREGPGLTYRRTLSDPAAVKISPLVPWTLRRDPTRAEVTITDFKSAIERSGTVPEMEKWTIGQELLGNGDIWAQPVVLGLGLRGNYAIFARSVGTAYVRAGRDGIVRRLGAVTSRVLPEGETFLVATDLTGGEVSIAQSGTRGQGIRSLRLVPVTAESVAAFEKETSQPPMRLVGHSDWLDFFLPGAESRMAADQFEAMVKGHGELGLRDLHWAAGRSVLLYESKLAAATRFPGTPLTRVDLNILKSSLHWPTWDYMNNQYCALTEAEQAAERHGVRLWPWLAMQRHYGSGAGGIFRSQWFASHPEWQEWRKHATKPRETEACYFFPEVRRERVDILCELAERKSAGIVVDANRQPPLLGYHPKMVAAYREKTGVDPRTIDASTGKVYEEWIRWRAGFFTETLRDLKTRLAPIRQRKGAVIAVVVRIPSAGLFYSLAQGFDVETWMREKLVDTLQLEPLEDLGGRGSHDVRPYVELGRRYQVQVLGGINANTFNNYSVVMKRAIGLTDAQVDGIYFFESNLFCVSDHQRWLVPLLGNPRRLADFLKSSNIEACDPVRATNACAGFDNHSGLYQWNVYDGKGVDSL